MERSEPTAEASLAAIFERSKFGIAMAAIIKMIATTIKSSMSEKPFCLVRIFSHLLGAIMLLDTECHPIRCKGSTMFASRANQYDTTMWKFMQLHALAQACL